MARHEGPIIFPANLLAYAILFDLKQPSCHGNTHDGDVFLRVRHVSVLRGRPSVPKKFWDLLHACTRHENSKYILHGGQTTCEEYYTGSTTPPVLAKIFGDTNLFLVTRDLFPIANLLV